MLLLFAQSHFEKVDEMGVTSLKFLALFCRLYPDTQMFLSLFANIFTRVVCGICPLSALFLLQLTIYTPSKCFPKAFLYWVVPSLSSAFAEITSIAYACLQNQT